MKQPEIQTTSNYKLFRHLKGNRQIVKNKITNLQKSYESGLNLFPFCPILVNKDNYVIDGQHRLETCKLLKIPVFYMVIENFTLLQIAQLNAISTKWKMSDYFNCFIENGNSDYKILEMFKDKYSISMNIAAQLLMNGSVMDQGGGIGDSFKNGGFKVKFQDKAEKIMKFVFAYQDIVEEESLLKDIKFIKALQLLSVSELYVHTQVLDKLTKNKSVIIKKSNVKEYIYHIEELYNKGNQNRYFIYQKAK